MKIGIANDHRGVGTKQQLSRYLESLGYEVKNYGTDQTVAVDYPTYAFKVGEAVAHHDVDFGILLCGTGIGMSIACNKVKGARCAKVNVPEESRLTRIDNDANVIALCSSQNIEELKELISVFLTTPFSKEERHQRRLQEIKDYEND